MKYLKSLILVLSLLILAGCSEKSVSLQPITLEYWGILDNDAAFTEILEDYQQTRPHITINYTQFNKDEYEEKLLNALAEDSGPDIYSLDSVDIKRFKNGLAFLPTELSIAKLTEDGQTVIQPEKTLPFKTIQRNYLDTLYKGMVLLEPQAFDDVGISLPREDKIYGLPLTTDTLVLYYNKDLYKNAGIENLPRTWDQFFEVVKLLTKKTANNRIIQSAAGIGTGNNINYSFDLLSVLMMQSGTIMTKADGNIVSFAERLPNSNTDDVPAARALQFYIDFALPFKESYTWNSKMQNSLDAFVQGKSAMYFGYSSDYNLIKQKSPKLNFGINYLPQIEGNKIINYAKYNLEVVSNKSNFVQESWDFLQFISDPTELSKYLKIVKQPTPIRQLILEQQTDERLTIFADQLLTATNWYVGYDYSTADESFKELIEDVHVGKYKTLNEGLNITARLIAETFAEPKLNQ